MTSFLSLRCYPAVNIVSVRNISYGGYSSSSTPQSQKWNSSCAFSFGKEDFQQYAIYFRFNIIGQLIGGHRKQNIALFDGIAFLELPFFNCALRHGQT